MNKVSVRNANNPMPTGQGMHSHILIHVMGGASPGDGIKYPMTPNNLLVVVDLHSGVTWYLVNF